MSDTQLQDLVDDSYPDQIRGPLRQVLTDTAWATQTEANNGWIPDPQLQAVAVLPGSQEPLQAAVVVLMWSGTDPVLGPRDRRLTRVAMTLINDTWVGKIVRALTRTTRTLWPQPQPQLPTDCQPVPDR